MDENEFRVVLVTRSQSSRHGDRLIINVKGRYTSREDAQVKLDKLKTHAKSCKMDVDYRLVDEKAYTKLLKLERADKVRRAEEGKVKAQKTRERNAAKGVKRKAPLRVMCPTCKCSSKVLYSEFGGLQTRKCKRGHTFTFDKWIADRPFAVIGAMMSGKGLYGKV